MAEKVGSALDRPTKSLVLLQDLCISYMRVHKHGGLLSHLCSSWPCSQLNSICFGVCVGLLNDFVDSDREFLCDFPGSCTPLGDNKIQQFLKNFSECICFVCCEVV